MKEKINLLKFIELKKISSFFCCAGLLVGLGFLSVYVRPLYIFGFLGVLILAFIIFTNPWRGVLLLAFFLPFERLGAYDFAGITIRPSQIAGVLTILALIFYYSVRRKFPIPKNPLLIPLGGFVVVMLLGFLNAPNFSRSLMVFAFTLFTIAIGFTLPFLLNSEKKVKQLLAFFFAAYLLVTIFGLYQFIGDYLGLPQALTGLRDLYVKDVLGFPRVQSTALEPLYFANYLLVPLSILLSLFLNKEKTYSSLFTFGLLVLGVVNLLLTVARGGYIAFAVSFLLIVLYYFLELKLITWRNVGIAFVSFLVAGGILVKMVGLETVSQDFLGHVSNLFGGASYNERVEMFTIAYQAWQDHPIIGIGAGSFGPYEAAHPNYMREVEGWRIVNNEYLELLAENGIVGLVLIMIVFIIVLLRSIKALKETSSDFIRTVLLGALAGFIGILVQYNTFSVLYIMHIWFTVGFLIALQNLALKNASYDSSHF